MSSNQKTVSLQLKTPGSFCVWSARRSYGVPTAAFRQQQQQQRGRGRSQSGASSDDVIGVGISNSGSCIRLLPSVPHGATCWCHTCTALRILCYAHFRLSAGCFVCHKQIRTN